jgi:DNA-binding transcriptional LysR family regulator
MDLLEAMATFTRVVEAGGLSAAAKQLRVSSAAVSRRIAALEAELGTKLLARSTRRMVVTPAGLRYYERCLCIQRDVAEAQSVSLRDATYGVLQVSAPVTFGMARVVPHMGTLMAKHAGLRVELRLDDRLVDLVVDGVDVAIRVGAAPPDTGDIVGHPLCSFRRVLVASPKYLKRRGTPATIEALAKHDALTHAFSGTGDTFVLVSDRREVRVRLNAVFRTNALHALRDLALLGAGLALLPDWFVDDDVVSGNLRAVLPGWTTPTVVASAIHRIEQRGAPRIRALVDHLRAAYGSATATRAGST